MIKKERICVQSTVSAPDLKLFALDAVVDPVELMSGVQIDYY